MPSNSYIILFGNKKLDILINYGRRHFKLFTYCHVSWDTLYVRQKNVAYFYFQKNILLQRK